MKKVGNSSDKQKSRRKKLETPILVTRIKGESRGKTFFGYARNISEGGMFIQTLNPRKVNEQFYIEFILPGEAEPIRGTIEVVWQRQLLSRKSYEPGMGVRFIHIKEDRSGEINKWVESRLEEEQLCLGGAISYA
ncbi:MAG: PilZ domain-containing protein [bacterium]|nr:PilZ domain-containing protein [bacterium]